MPFNAISLSIVPTATIFISRRLNHVPSPSVNGFTRRRINAFASIAGLIAKYLI